jgi:hypothetical protein
MNYHDDYGSVSKTMLTDFVGSPSLYYETYIKRTMQRKQPTQPMLVGTILHGVLLEGKKPDEMFRVYPEDCLKSNGAINPKPAGEFRRSIGSAVAIKEKDAHGIEAAIKAARESAISKALELATETENAHYADVYGLPCKCKPDIAADMGDRWDVWDLKFCDPSPGHFFRSAKRFKYWLQDVHYSAVITQETGKPVTFRFLAFEPEYPFRLQSYWYEPRQREIGSDFHRLHVAKLLKCMATDSWEDNWPHSIPLSPWDVDPSGESVELEGFDDEQDAA